MMKDILHGFMVFEIVIDAVNIIFCRSFFWNEFEHGFVVRHLVFLAFVSFFIYIVCVFFSSFFYSLLVAILLGCLCHTRAAKWTQIPSRQPIQAHCRFIGYANVAPKKNFYSLIMDKFSATCNAFCVCALLCAHLSCFQVKNPFHLLWTNQ